MVMVNIKRVICAVLLFNVACCVLPRETIADEEYTPIRLVDGYYPGEGRVEVAHGGQYGTVCKDGSFDTNEAKVLCRMLGYSTEGTSFNTAPDSGGGPVWLNQLQCTGKEEDIGECAHPGWGHVTCSNSVWLSCPTTKIRLVSGPSYRAGRLEVYHGSSWGRVCSRGWDQHSANVVCRMLGLNDETGLVYHNGYFGQGTGAIMMNDISCEGYEMDLASCRVTWQSGANCSHSQDVGIACEVRPPENGAVRLIGVAESDGRVEIFHEGKWGSICDASWTDEDAGVVCQMLGFTDRKSKAEKSFKRERDGYIWLDGTLCTGTETSLLDCPFDSWGSSSQTCPLAGVNCDARNTTEIRLVGDRMNTGRLEILHNGTWGTVCDDSFNSDAADIACEMLGFPRSGSALPYFGGGGGPIWLDHVTCTGSEDTLDECGHSAWGHQGCLHKHDVGVKCSTNFTSLIRLNGDWDHKGRLEVFYNGSWGTVCNHGRFSDISTGIVCEMLGFPRVGQLIPPDDVGSGPIWLEGVECQGTESTLFQCVHNGWGIHSCSHSDDVGVFCGEYQYENTSTLVRLVGPTPTEGRLEVFHNGEWGSVCDDSFGIQEAAVVCSMLGLGEYGDYISHYGGGNGRIWLDDVRCSLGDEDLFQCSHSGWGVTDCGHTEDVGVNCSVSKPLHNSSLVRLVGPTPTEGRLEVFHNGEWGSVCDDSFGIQEAAVVCSMLGFGRRAMGTRWYEGGKGSIWLDDVRCSPGDEDLFQCSHSGWGVTDCGHHEDVMVKCISKTPNSRIIRLVGPSSTEGRLEVFYNGQWGSVCGDSFGNREAALACSTLGFVRSGKAIQSYGGGTGQIWLDEVSCSSSDDSFFQCRNAGWGSNDCTHSQDVGVSCLPQDLESAHIRLVGPQYNSGRVEVFHDGMWGTVCSDTFRDVEADVTCRMLGLGRVVRRHTNMRGEGRIWLSGVSCGGNETSLFDCGFTGWGQTSCSHHDDVGIECSDTVSTHNYRPSLSGSGMGGRLQLSLNDSHLDVCLDAVSLTTTKKICTILGFDTSNRLYKLLTDGRYGTVTTNPVVTSVQCTGDEKILEQCEIVTASSCPVGQVSSLGLDCLESKVRLIGMDRWMGRLEVNMNGTWGTVCNKDFDNNDALVVCRMIIKNKGVTVTGYGMSGVFIGGSSYYPIVLGYLNCNGQEEDIAGCASSYKPESEYFKSNCDHSTDAEVQCRASVSVRLTGGGNSTEGRVEVFVGGEWGSVCSLSSADARVICRMLGYWESNPVIRSEGYFTSSTLNHSIVRANCRGSEPNLALCQWDTTSSCSSKHGVGLTCRSAPLKSSSIRLRGDTLPWRGQIQVRPWSHWGYLHDSRNITNTEQSVCKTLGFSFVNSWPLHPSLYRSNFHMTGVPELVHSLRCSGHEDNIGECRTDTNQFPYSDSDSSLNVDCVGSPNIVRLVNGSSPLEGRVEVLYNGSWGTVCDSGWGTSDTRVLCRSLGFQSRSTTYVYSSHYGEGTGPIHFSNMDCSGSEVHISQCSNKNETSCVHSQDIGVRCAGCVRVFNTTTGSIDPRSDCYFVIKPNAGPMMLELNLFNIYKYGHSQTVEIRTEPTGQYLGKYSNNDHVFIAGREFWLYYVSSSYGNQFHVRWKPLRIDDVVTVDCSHTHWNVSVNITNLAVLYGAPSTPTIYIGDCNSPSRSADGALYLTPLLTDCGTTENSYVAQVSPSGVVSFKNVLAYREQSGLNHKVNLQCNTSSESSSDIDQRSIDTIPSSTVQTLITGSGRPESSVRLYTDPYYYKEPVDNGSRINIGQPVYVKVTLQSPDPRDKMVVQDCYAKLGVDAGASQTYKLIDNGCPVDSSVHIDSMVDTETRFYFHMFAFPGDRPHVVVYCDTSYCDKGNKLKWVPLVID